jgi:protein NirF
LKKHEATFTVGGNVGGNVGGDAAGKQLPSRVTGVVDAPGNRFVCVLIEGAEIWVVDASKPGFPIEHRIKTKQDNPYDAMITPDGRYYVVGHMESDRVSVLDLTRPEAGIREVSLRDPSRHYDKDMPVKLPHLASWAVAGKWIFVPLVGEDRLAVLDRATWEFSRSIPLRGHPVYAVRSPTEREVWVSFSGEEDDAFVQVIDVDTLTVKDSLRVGRRIYHMDFTPRGSHVLISANRDNKLFLVNASTREIEDSVDLESPSGIFGVWRAFRIGL